MSPKKNPDAPGRLSGLAKALVVTVTAMAGLMGLLVNARNLGLTPWLRTAGLSFADLAAQRVVVTPVADTLHAVGDTLHLMASVTDQHGAMLSGATILWVSEDSSVAVVDSMGDVVARGPGTATISASVREHRAVTRISVRQSVRAVAIAHDSVIRLGEGATQQLEARALDARGHLVQGRGASWASADSAVLAVNAAGLARAVGPGRTSVTATIDGYTARIAAEVVLQPATFHLLAASEMRAPAGGRVQQPIQVEVLSRGGRPVPGVPVSFVAAADEGAAEPDKMPTDRIGRARAVWTLGPHAGRQRLTVTIAGIDSVISLVAEADPVPKRTRVQQTGAAPSASAGSKVAVAVRVTDPAGAAMADVPVSWSASDGQVRSLMARTDSVGQAAAEWTLGPRAGTQHAAVQVGNARTMPPFTVTATALPDSAATLALVSGGAQRGEAGSALERAIEVRVADRGGNAVSGAAARVTVSDGAVEDSAPLSDGKGMIKVRWTLGHRAGPQTLAIAVGSRAPLKVTARVAPRAPANIAFGTLPETGRTGRALPKPVTITVTDVYGNAVPEAPVTFTVSSGSVQPARLVTDADGRASTKWTLGAAAGDQMLSAAVRGTNVKTGAVVHATKTGD